MILFSTPLLIIVKNNERFLPFHVHISFFSRVNLWVAAQLEHVKHIEPCESCEGGSASAPDKKRLLLYRTNHKAMENYYYYYSSAEWTGSSSSSRIGCYHSLSTTTASRKSNFFPLNGTQQVLLRNTFISSRFAFRALPAS